MRFKAILFLLVCSVALSAQIPVGPSIIYSTINPAGAACANTDLQWNVVGPGSVYTCQSNVYTQVSGGGGGGITALTGDVTASGTGSVVATVTGLGGIPFSNIPAPSVSDVICYDGVQYTPCPPSAGSAQILYPTSASSDIGTYDVLDITPIGGQFTVFATIPATTTKTLIKAFATASGYPNVTLIPAGEWQSDTYVQVSSAANTTTLNIDVYKRATGGTETLLFSFSSPTISGNGAAIQHFTIESVQPAFAILVTDRIVTKYSMTKTGGASITGTVYGGGTANYSHIHTPLGVGIGYLPLAGGTLTGPLNGTDASFSGTVSANTMVSGAPSSGALAALPSGAHGLACDESSTVGVPASGVDYIRCDATTHRLMQSLNGAAEVNIPLPSEIPPALAAQYKIAICSVGMWNGGAAIAAGTYTIPARCYNAYGVTYTITGAKCYSNNSGSSTVNVADSGSNALLTGAITATPTWASGTQSATTTIASGVWTNWTFVSDGVSTAIQCVMTTTR